MKHTHTVVALVRDEDYAQSLSLLLAMAGVHGHYTTDERRALELIALTMPSVVLLDTRLRTRLTPIFDHIQRHAIDRNTQLVFLASSAVLPVGDHLRLPLMTVDRHNGADILLAVRHSLGALPAHT